MVIKYQQFLTKFKQKVLDNKRLPYWFQYVLAIIIYFVLSIFLTIFFSGWSQAIICVILSYISIEIINQVGVKYLQDVETKNSKNVSLIEEQAIIISQQYESHGGFILANAVSRNNIELTPVLACKIAFLRGDNRSLLSSVSNNILSQMSSKYNCSFVDTNTFSALILKSVSLRVKKTEITETIEDLERVVFPEIVQIIHTIQHQSNINFETVAKKNLSILFPLYDKVISIPKNQTLEEETEEEESVENQDRNMIGDLESLAPKYDNQFDLQDPSSEIELDSIEQIEKIDTEPLKSVKELNIQGEISSALRELDVINDMEHETIELGNQNFLKEIEIDEGYVSNDNDRDKSEDVPDSFIDLQESVSSQKNEEEENDQGLSVEERDKIDRLKKNIKDVLITKLGYSFDSFARTVNGFYKKAIENQLEKAYPLDETRFMKAVNFCSIKNYDELVFPSYSYLERIVNYVEIEMPSSTEINNFVDKFLNEYLSINLSDEKKKTLNSYLDTKISVKKDKVKDKEQTRLNEKIKDIPIPKHNPKQSSLVEWA